MDSSMTDLNTQMSGESLDITEQRKQELKQLFPGVFTEVKNDKGEIVEAIDFERLKAELGSFSELYEGRRERYGMDWPGKRDCLRLIQEPSRATLKPCREESVDFDNTENLFIEGDNLEVLKLLQKAYYGKIKMIYIDPPYNTGKEFIYPDNFSESLETYLSYAGLSGEDGKKFSTNSANEGRFHTKWLNMMFPRLYLARNLLCEDGVIFISIDDNEVQNLRRICDEIFGEDNFLSQIIVQSNKRGQTYKEIAKCHEYILVYYKTECSELGELEKSEDALPYKDELGSYDLWELRNRNPKFGRHNRENLYYPIYVDVKSVDGEGLARVSLEKTQDFSVEVTPVNSEGVDGCWRWSKDKLIKDGITVNPQSIFARQRRDGGWNIYEKSRKSTTKAKSIWSDNLVINEQGTIEAGRLDMSGMLEHPKPIELIKRCIKLATTEGDIVLDFFAGSGTTYHSVLSQTIEDGLKRKTILVQIPEPTYEIIKDKKIPKTGCDAAFLSGHGTIASVAKERMRRAIRMANHDVSSQLSFTDKGRLDLGFKVLKLNRSNFKQWQISNIELMDDELKKQLELHIDQVDPNATQEDILYELLIKAGVMPTKKIELIELADHAVFSVDDGGWLICLQDKVEQALIDAVLEKEPVQFICLDRAFHGNDQLKANAVSCFANFNEGRDKADQIEFRTV
jgi:adenine-specific DNA-methyltransferase